MTWWWAPPSTSTTARSSSTAWRARVANRSFFAPGIRLQRGVNEVTAEARDRAGNTARSTVRVTVQDQAGQRLRLVSGSNQQASAGAGLAEPLVVALVDADGGAAVDRPVTFEVSRGTGLLGAFPEQGTRVTVRTDDNGLARILYNVGSRSGVGNHRVVASAPGYVGTAEFCATATPKSPARIGALSGDRQHGAVNEPLPEPFVTLVIDEMGNPVAGAQVSFQVVSGGGNFDGTTTREVVTDGDGLASAVLTLGPDAGEDNNAVVVAFPGLPPGGEAQFLASGAVPGLPESTSIVGVVIDNQNNPVPAATVSVHLVGIDLDPIPTSQSDAQGRFRLDNVPDGPVMLIVDGVTTSREGRWPTLEFNLNLVPGQVNEMPDPVYLLPLADNAVLVPDGGPPQDVTLRMPGVDGAELTIFANSVSCPVGQSECAISWTQVNGERVPMQPPLGSAFMLAGTLQPAGTHFDQPARLCIPNANELPGQQVEMYSFDHDLGDFVALGTATVSADGAQICSDPGFGINKAGWHGCVPPPSPLGDLLGALGDFFGDLFGGGASTNGGGDTGDSPNGGDTGADPIILATGELRVAETDLRIAGRGFDFILSRTYRSQFNYNGPLGNNWDFSYNERLQLPEAADPDQSVQRVNGHGRIDTYAAQPDGSFIAPDGFYDELFRNADDTWTIRDRFGFERNFDAQGRLVSHVDRNGNTMSFNYDADDRLVEVIDTLGRRIEFGYYDTGRLASVTDFTGREVQYRYDPNGDLVSVRSPVVTGTSTGNDFPGGKVRRYVYSSGFDEDSDPRLAALNHNLLEIIDGKGQHYLENTYGTDPDAFDFDRVIRQREGGPDQVYTLEYAALNPGVTPVTPDLPRSQTLITDRNGNRRLHVHNANANLLQLRVETNRDVNPDDPDVFVTRHTYNEDGQRLSSTFPEGNSVVFVYDDANPNPLQHGNLLSITRNPGPRGGDQAQLVETFAYEPIYNRLRSETDPRGNDPTFVPPNGGVTSTERYTKRYTFDYQEGDNLAALAAEMRREESEVGALLAAAGVALGIGDVNGDGVTDGVNGNEVRLDEPTVNLLADNSLVAVEGDTTQESISSWTYNRFGQRVTATDPEGNVDQYFYYPENDPDGDGTTTLSPRTLAADTGGYKSAEVRDAAVSPRRRSSAPLTEIRMDYRYDDVGNVVEATDGNGNPTIYERNALNQIVKVILEPPFLYEIEFHYDANNNLVRQEVENRDTNGPDLDSSVTTTYVYDILDNRTERREEVSTSETLVTRYEYDANENVVRLVQPEGNVVERTYDERDLVFSSTVGAGSPDASTRTFTYDGNANLTRAVDAEDNNGDGAPEQTTRVYDGYDRQVSLVDAAGNEIRRSHDPFSNMTVEERYGPNGGATPTDSSGAANVLLSRAEYAYDERNRVFERHRALFSNTGTAGPEGPLSPGDGRVSMRFEHDRDDRIVREVDDNGHEQRYVLDGADRRITDIDELGNELRFAYDDNDNRIEVTEIDVSPQGTVPDESFVTTIDYDALDRPIRVEDNLGNVRTAAYDSRNNRVLRTDALNNTRITVYDGINRALEVSAVLRTDGTGASAVDTSNPENPDGRITRRNEWDGNSRLRQVIDDRGNTTTYTYDALDRRRIETFEDGTTLSYVYDRDDNVISIVDQNGSVHTQTFDGINRLVEKQVARAAGVEGTTQQRFEYDGLSRRTRAIDINDPATNADDSQLILRYDSLHRVIQELQNGRSVATTFDGVGRKLRSTYPNGREVVSQFDGLDRVISRADDGAPGFIAEYDYLGPDRTLERRLGNGTRLTYHDGGADVGYDGIKRVVRHRHLGPADELIAGFEQAWDAESNRRYEIDLFRNRADVFQYDSAYRLTRAAKGADPGGTRGHRQQ